MKPLLLSLCLLVGGCSLIGRGSQGELNPETLLSDPFLTTFVAGVTSGECAAFCAQQPESCEDLVMAVEKAEAALKGCKYGALQSFLEAKGAKTIVIYGE